MTTTPEVQAALDRVTERADDFEAHYGSDRFGWDVDGVSVADLRTILSALATSEARREALEVALDPFARISSEGLIKTEAGHVRIVTSAEYFHRAAALFNPPTGREPRPWVSPRAQFWKP